MLPLTLKSQRDLPATAFCKKLAAAGGAAARAACETPEELATSPVVKAASDPVTYRKVVDRVCTPGSPEHQAATASVPKKTEEQLRRAHEMPFRQEAAESNALSSFLKNLFGPIVSPVVAVTKGVTDTLSGRLVDRLVKEGSDLIKEEADATRYQFARTVDMNVGMACQVIDDAMTECRTEFTEHIRAGLSQVETSTDKITASVDTAFSKVRETIKSSIDEVTAQAFPAMQAVGAAADSINNMVSQAFSLIESLRVNVESTFKQVHANCLKFVRLLGSAIASNVMSMFLSVISLATTIYLDLPTHLRVMQVLQIVAPAWALVDLIGCTSLAEVVPSFVSSVVKLCSDFFGGAWGKFMSMFGSIPTPEPTMQSDDSSSSGFLTKLLLLCLAAFGLTEATSIADFMKKVCSMGSLESGADSLQHWIGSVGWSLFGVDLLGTETGRLASAELVVEGHVYDEMSSDELLLNVSKAQDWIKRCDAHLSITRAFGREKHQTYPLAQVYSSVRQKIANYRSAKNVVADRPDTVCIHLHGEPGAGKSHFIKTHAVPYLVQSLNLAGKRDAEGYLVDLSESLYILSQDKYDEPPRGEQIALMEDLGADETPNGSYHRLIALASGDPVRLDGAAVEDKGAHPCFTSLFVTSNKTLNTLSLGLTNEARKALASRMHSFDVVNPAVGRVSMATNRFAERSESVAESLRFYRCDPDQGTRLDGDRYYTADQVCQYIQREIMLAEKRRQARVNQVRNVARQAPTTNFKAFSPAGPGSLTGVEIPPVVRPIYNPQQNPQARPPPPQRVLGAQPELPGRAAARLRRLTEDMELQMAPPLTIHSERSAAIRKLVASKFFPELVDQSVIIPEDDRFLNNVSMAVGQLGDLPDLSCIANEKLRKRVRQQIANSWSEDQLRAFTYFWDSRLVTQEDVDELGYSADTIDRLCDFWSDHRDLIAPIPRFALAESIVAGRRVVQDEWTYSRANIWLFHREWFRKRATEYSGLKFGKREPMGLDPVDVSYEPPEEYFEEDEVVVSQAAITKVERNMRLEEVTLKGEHPLIAPLIFGLRQVGRDVTLAEKTPSINRATTPTELFRAVSDEQDVNIAVAFRVQGETTLYSYGRQDAPLVYLVNAGDSWYWGNWGAQFAWNWDQMLTNVTVIFERDYVLTPLETFDSSHGIIVTHNGGSYYVGSPDDEVPPTMCYLNGKWWQVNYIDREEANRLTQLVGTDSQVELPDNDQLFELPSLKRALFAHTLSWLCVSSLPRYILLKAVARVVDRIPEPGNPVLTGVYTGIKWLTDFLTNGRQKQAYSIYQGTEDFKCWCESHMTQRLTIDAQHISSRGDQILRLTREHHEPLLITVTDGEFHVFGEEEQARVWLDRGDYDHFSSAIVAIETDGVVSLYEPANRSADYRRPPRTVTESPVSYHPRHNVRAPAVINDLHGLPQVTAHAKAFFEQARFAAHSDRLDIPDGRSELRYLTVSELGLPVYSWLNGWQQTPVTSADFYMAVTPKHVTYAGRDSRAYALAAPSRLAPYVPSLASVEQQIGTAIMRAHNSTKTYHALIKIPLGVYHIRKDSSGVRCSFEPLCSTAPYDEQPTGIQLIKHVITGNYPTDELRVRQDFDLAAWRWLEGSLDDYSIITRGVMRLALLFETVKAYVTRVYGLSFFQLLSGLFAVWSAWTVYRNMQWLFGIGEEIVCVFDDVMDTNIGERLGIWEWVDEEDEDGPYQRMALPREAPTVLRGLGEHRTQEPLDSPKEKRHTNEGRKFSPLVTLSRTVATTQKYLDEIRKNGSVDVGCSHRGKEYLLRAHEAKSGRITVKVITTDPGRLKQLRQSGYWVGGSIIPQMYHGSTNFDKTSETVTNQVAWVQILSNDIGAGLGQGCAIMMNDFIGYCPCHFVRPDSHLLVTFKDGTSMRGEWFRTACDPMTERAFFGLVDERGVTASKQGMKDLSKLLLPEAEIKQLSSDNSSRNTGYIIRHMPGRMHQPATVFGRFSLEDYVCENEDTEGRWKWSKSCLIVTGIAEGVFDKGTCGSPYLVVRNAKSFLVGCHSAAWLNTGALGNMLSVEAWNSAVQKIMSPQNCPSFQGLSTDETEEAPNWVARKYSYMPEWSLEKELPMYAPRVFEVVSTPHTEQLCKEYKHYCPVGTGVSCVSLIEPRPVRKQTCKSHPVDHPALVQFRSGKEPVMTRQAIEAMPIEESKIRPDKNGAIYLYGQRLAHAMDRPIDAITVGKQQMLLKIGHDLGYLNSRALGVTARKFRVFSVDEMVTGLPSSGIHGINTAASLATLEHVIPGITNENLYEKDMNGMNTLADNQFGRAFRELARDTLDAACKNGSYIALPGICEFKQELLEHKKIHKPRIFMNMPPTANIAMKCLTADATSAHLGKAEFTGIWLSEDIIHDGHKLAWRLTHDANGGDKFFAFDVEKNDNTASAAALQSCVEYYSAFFDNGRFGPEHSKFRTEVRRGINVLLRGAYSTPLICDNAVVILRSTMPSGKYNTSMDDAIMNICRMLYVLIKIGAYESVEEAMEGTRLEALGDDMCGRLEESLLEQGINQKTIAAAWKEHFGVTLTPGDDKDSVLKESLHLDEVSFVGTAIAKIKHPSGQYAAHRGMCLRERSCASAFAYSKSYNPSELADAHQEVLKHVVLHGPAKYQQYLEAAQAYARDHQLENAQYLSYEQMLRMRWEAGDPRQVPAAHLRERVGANLVTIEVAPIAPELSRVSAAEYRRAVAGGSSMSSSRAKTWVSRALARAEDRDQMLLISGAVERIPPLVCAAVADGVPMQVVKKPKTSQSITAFPVNDPVFYGVVLPTIPIPDAIREEILDGFADICRSVEGVTEIPQPETRSEIAFNRILRGMRAVMRLHRETGPCPMAWQALREWAIPELLANAQSSSVLQSALPAAFGRMSVEEVLQSASPSTRVAAGAAAAVAAVGLSWAGYRLRYPPGRSQMQAAPEAGHAGVEDARPVQIQDVSSAVMALNRSLIGPTAEYEKRILQFEPLEIIKIPAASVSSNVIAVRKFDFWDPQSTGAWLNQRTAFYKYVTGFVQVRIDVRQQAYTTGTILVIPFTESNVGDITEASTTVDPIQAAKAVPVAGTTAAAVGDQSALAQRIDLSMPGQFTITCPITTSEPAPKGVTPTSQYTCGYIIVVETDLGSSIKVNTSDVFLTVHGCFANLQLSTNVIGAMADATPDDSSNPYGLSILTRRKDQPLAGTIASNAGVPEMPKGTLFLDGKSLLTKTVQEQLSYPHYGPMRFDMDDEGLLHFRGTVCEVNPDASQADTGGEIHKDYDFYDEQDQKTTTKVHKYSLAEMADQFCHKCTVTGNIGAKFGYGGVHATRDGDWSPRPKKLTTLTEDLFAIGEDPLDGHIAIPRSVINMKSDQKFGQFTTADFAVVAGRRYQITGEMPTYSTVTIYNSPPWVDHNNWGYSGSVLHSVAHNPHVSRCYIYHRSDVEIEWTNMRMHVLETSGGYSDGWQLAFRRIHVDQTRMPGLEYRDTNLDNHPIVPSAATPADGPTMHYVSPELQKVYVTAGNEHQSDLRTQTGSAHKYTGSGVDSGLQTYHGCVDHFPWTPRVKPESFDVTIRMGRLEGYDTTYYHDVALPAWEYTIADRRQIACATPHELNQDASRFGAGTDVVSQLFGQAAVKLALSGTPVAKRGLDAAPEVPAGYVSLGIANDDEMVPTVLSGITGRTVPPNIEMVQFHRAVIESLNRDGSGSYLYYATMSGSRIVVLANRHGLYVNTGNNTDLFMIAASSTRLRISSVSRQADPWAAPQSDLSGFLDRTVSAAQPMGAYKGAGRSPARTVMNPDMLMQLSLQRKREFPKGRSHMFAAAAALGGAMNGATDFFKWSQANSRANKYLDLQRQMTEDTLANQLKISKIQAGSGILRTGLTVGAQMEMQKMMIAARYGNQANMSTGFTGHNPSATANTADAPPPYSEKEQQAEVEKETAALNSLHPGGQTGMHLVQPASEETSPKGYVETQASPADSIPLEPVRPRSRGPTGGQATASPAASSSSVPAVRSTLADWGQGTKALREAHEPLNGYDFDGAAMASAAPEPQATMPDLDTAVKQSMVEAARGPAASTQATPATTTTPAPAAAATPVAASVSSPTGEATSQNWVKTTGNGIPINDWGPVPTAGLPVAQYSAQSKHMMWLMGGGDGIGAYKSGRMRPVTDASGSLRASYPPQDTPLMAFQPGPAHPGIENRLRKRPAKPYGSMVFTRSAGAKPSGI
ncbi:hypothetical protein [Beihai picorna-like virus 108]|uniref:hypothetical protein n=1 Tax=Beihai picorna-like virus 108 TaxID=1922536 RepID=UPI00090A00FB|nr:hypothetical protein [Beihai picorna-like virus 108]APG76881.1 hypothetical protein [Beihai picorna-like virus 108]